MDGIAGSRRDLVLESEAAARLAVAAAHLSRSGGPGHDLTLLVWDAHRSSLTQRSIFDRYVEQLLVPNGKNRASAINQAKRFVSDPDSVFPHGTGGAVDVTVLIDGERAYMGTGFDSFETRAARDWYAVHPPQAAADVIAARNRALLRAAMEAAGFVGLDSEWWHFEWGTDRWARATGHQAVLTEVLSAPPTSMPAPLCPAPEPVM